MRSGSTETTWKRQRPATVTSGRPSGATTGSRKAYQALQPPRGTRSSRPAKRTVTVPAARSTWKPRWSGSAGRVSPRGSGGPGTSKSASSPRSGIGQRRPPPGSVRVPGSRSLAGYVEVLFVPRTSAARSPEGIRPPGPRRTGAGGEGGACDGGLWRVGGRERPELAALGQGLEPRQVPLLHPAGQQARIDAVEAEDHEAPPRVPTRSLLPTAAARDQGDREQHTHRAAQTAYSSGNSRSSSVASLVTRMPRGESL